MTDIDEEVLFERTQDAMDVYEDGEDFELGCGDPFCDICGDPPEGEGDDSTELD